MISQTAEYALRAIVFLADQQGTARTTAQIAEVTQVPPGYLAKVMQSLSLYMEEAYGEGDGHQEMTGIFA